MRSIGSNLPAWSVVLLGASLAGSARAAAQVAVVIHEAQDREVGAQLGQLIDVPVSERAGDRSIGALMEQAAAWPEPHVVVIDRPSDTIHVLRPRDRTIVSRVLASEVMLDSQYAVALASAELLEWLGVLPAARGQPSAIEARSASPGALGGQPAPSEASAQPEFALGWAVGADLELAASPGHDVSLARASISGEVQLGRGRPAWFAFGARLGAPASWDRQLEPALTAARAERVVYSDVLAGLHAAVGYGEGSATILGQIEGGLSLLHVEAFAGDELRIGDHDAAAPWLGLGVGLRYRLAWGVSLAAGLQGHWLAERATYRVEGTPVLEEGPVRMTTRIGLIWESALVR